MVILCRYDGPHRQQAIASGFAVDDDGLAPFLLQRVGDQPRTGVRSGARTERQHEAHRMRGPLLGEAGRHGARVNRQREGDHIETKPTVEHEPSPRPCVRWRERSTPPARSAQLWTMANRIVQCVAAYPEWLGLQTVRVLEGAIVNL